MAQLSPPQCRAARALLDWQQRDLSKKSGVAKQTILQFERGRSTPWARTINDLRRVFEEAGIEFLDAMPGGGGIGVRMREGFDAITKTDDTETSTQSDGKGGLDALWWDWDAEPVEDNNEPLPPLDWTDEDRADQIEHWRSRPEAWAKLHEISRQCLLRAMGVERL